MAVITESRPNNYLWGGMRFSELWQRTQKQKTELPNQVAIESLDECYEPNKPLADIITYVSGHVANLNGSEAYQFSPKKTVGDPSPIYDGLNAVVIKGTDILDRSLPGNNETYVEPSEECPFTLADFIDEKIRFGLLAPGAKPSMSIYEEYAELSSRWALQNGRSPEQLRALARMQKTIAAERTPPSQQDLAALSQVHIPFAAAAETVAHAGKSHPTIALESRFAEALTRFYSLADSIENRELGNFDHAGLSTIFGPALERIIGDKQVLQCPYGFEKNAVYTALTAMRQRLGDRFKTFITNFPNLEVLYYDPSTVFAKRK